MILRSSALVFAACLAICVFCAAPPVLGQSKPQKPTQTSGDSKKNNRPSDDDLKKAADEEKRKEEEKNTIVDDTVEKIVTNIVSVDAVVINKKSGQIINGLKKENFAIFENGVKQEISSFATPESPITVSLVVEFSKWTEMFGAAAGGGWEPGTYEVIRPVATFVSRFIKAPDDYASIIAFDIRPTPITDFTNDPRRLSAAVDVLLRSQPAFRENNMFDAVKFALIGGTADSVVLENSKQSKAEYGGMVDVRSKRRAIILVASGIDTFSRTNYDQVRRIIQEAGVPIYIISTGNLFYKRFENYLPAVDDITGGPGRLTFLQAKNTMNTLAKESGGVHYEMTFEGEIPGYLQNINAMLRSQYSLAYDLGEKHEPGKKYKIEVKVDADGDGVYEEKVYQIQHKPYFTMPKAAEKKK